MVGGASLALAKDQTVIEKLPAYAGAKALTASEYPEQQKALAHALMAYLREGYQLGEQRFFAVDDAVVRWVAIESFVDEHLAQFNARRERLTWHRAGIDLFAVWSLNEASTMHFAVALSPDPLPDGRRLVGYFYLTRG
jgi:hypothetical protein